MGTGIYGQPNEYDFGLDFDYAIWTPNTIVNLVNVPWNNDYRDVVRFESPAIRKTYLDNRSSSGITITQLSYVKPNEPVRINVPFNRALKYNYLRARNPLQPVPGNDVVKEFYYFILDVRYIAPNTSELVLQLDVWQTYNYDVSIGNCYVERGHIGIANENQLVNYGQDYLTVPEGIDTGPDYRVIATREDTVMSVGIGYTGDTLIDQKVNILVISTTDLTSDPGTVTAPKLKSAEGSNLHGLPSGASIYIFESQNAFFVWMSEMQEYPWITQGIVSVTVVPLVERYGNSMVSGDGPVETSIVTTNRKHKFFPKWRESDEIRNAIDERYRDLHKFKTSPYMIIEATTWTATPVVLKPESWKNADADFLERANYMPPAQRVEFTPRQYNSNGQKIANAFGMSDETLATIIDSLPPEDRQHMYDHYYEVGDDGGDYLDVMTLISSFPTLPIVNNMAISYLASNAATIPYQRASADWSQQRALGMAQGQYDIASGGISTANKQTNLGINTASDLTQIGNDAQALHATVNGAASVLGGVAGGAALGPAGALTGLANGAVSAASGGLNAAIDIGANNAGLAVRNSQSRESNAFSNAQAGLVRDTNKSLADWGARGDYANAIAGINAKVQDSAMIQPSMSGQYGGDSTNLVNDTMEINIRWKFIHRAAMRIIGEYWLRYGYAIRAFIKMPSTFMVMSKFTYWKLTETYISVAEIPEGFKQAFRGMFEKGVTVWANPDDIGNIDLADNKPLQGVKY